MSVARLGVFARAPVAGRTKTRLIPALGPEGAAELHRRLIERVVASLAPAVPGGTELWCDPDAGDPFLAACATRHGLALHAQPGGSLGERMRVALDAMLARSQVALVVGTDCPLLHATDIAAAVDLLERGADLVLAPAEDGGYALIGARAFVPEQLFANVAWGQGEVEAQTVRNADAIGWTVARLRRVWDVDRPEDLARLRAFDPGLLAGLEIRA